MICKFCKRKIKEEDSVCQYCGNILEEKKNKNMVMRKSIGIADFLIAAFFAFLVVKYGSGFDKNTRIIGSAGSFCGVGFWAFLAKKTRL